MKAKKLAIFDIDGTIFRSGLFIELFYATVKQGTFDKKVLKEVEREYLEWINRRGHYMTYGLKLVSIYDREVKGKKESDIEKAARSVVLEQKDKVYVFTRNLLHRLKKESYYLLAISGSPQVIVREFVRHYGFDRYFSTEHEVVNGKFTGEVGGIKLKKADAVKKFLEDFGDFDYKSSIGVGDTESDIDFLEKVANPIAFNPSIELARYAKKKKWRVVVERKDVIYDIGNFKILD